MSAQPNTETRVKVWRPAGFPGLEIEKDIHVFGRLYRPKEVMFCSDLTVHTRGRANGYAFFDKTYHRPKQVAGLVFLQNAGDVFEVDADFTEPMSGSTVRLLQGHEEELLGSLGLETEGLHFDQAALTDRVRERLARDIERTTRCFEAPTSTLERESRLLELFAFALEHCSDTQLVKKIGQEHRAVRRAKEVLDTQPERDNTLAELAHLTGLNPHYLYRVFVRDIGLSPHGYQTSVRLNQVKMLLAKGVPIAQAAIETGFSDQSHLTHVFKKHTQVTPGRFRRDSLGAGGERVP